jgi:DNA polymerase III epsilon subunit family exonuclease
MSDSSPRLGTRRRLGTGADADMQLVVLDTETGGLDAFGDCLVEIGAVLLDDALGNCSTFHRRIRPSTRIAPEARAVHGLTSRSLSDAPDLLEVVSELAAWLPEKPVMVGQNVWFDAAFISRAFRSCEVPYPFDYHVLDIWGVASFVLPRVGEPLPGYDLDELCLHFAIDRQLPHSAMSDALAAAEALRHLDRLLIDVLGRSLAG